MDIEQYIGVSKKEALASALLITVFFVLVFVSRYSRLESSNAINFEEGIHVYLESNTGLDGLIDHLKNEDANFDEEAFRWASRLLGWRSFQQGHYYLKGTYPYEELFSKIALGIQDPVNVTILPGINAGRFANSLSNSLNIDSTQVMAQLSDSTFLYKLKLNKEQLFGRMLPDTYSMYWTTSPESVLRKILDEFNERVSKPYNERATELGYSIDEVVAMASIVEWEASIVEEKPIISGLYWNRIKKRMYLQADPTVNFALGERRRLLFKDYSFNHPFNTYVNIGLPPGAITNPSLNTIEATLFPEQHNYIYMVANPEGGHVFTRTFKEHQIESEKWRKWLQRQYRIKRQRESEDSTSASQ
tara:strand:+ start:19709 stop:20788 length:1080 start_codon:yes stop_codon:yes gene_type:complete